MSEFTTSTRALGIQIRPRLPDFGFDEALPHLHAGAEASTAWINMMSAFTTVAERMFARSSAMMMPLVERPEHREELAAFMQQEALHTSMHERLNRVLRARGYPIEEFQAYLQQMMDAAVEEGGHRMVVAMALAGEQANGVFSDAILDQPGLLVGWDERVRLLFQWHAYEEVEHTAALFDAFLVAMKNPEDAYRLRMWGVAYIASIVLAAWGVGLHAFLEHGRAGDGTSLRRWRELGAFLFGEQGLLRDEDRNLLAYLRRDFHPWQGRDARDRLQKHQAFAPAAWNRDEPRKQATGERGASKLEASSLRAPVVHAREARRFVRFLARLGVKTARFACKTGARTRPGAG
ncbi:MAG: metal-dependent hydrolase [Polyangiaceae bacterium]|jgi:hypothetical protein|nr:metal-dependent hydrolase [Polyangiaceae bacterium]